GGWHGLAGVGGSPRGAGGAPPGGEGPRGDPPRRERTGGGTSTGRTVPSLPSDRSGFGGLPAGRRRRLEGQVRRGLQPATGRPTLPVRAGWRGPRPRQDAARPVPPRGGHAR